ncbi:MAG: outer membrane protein assembly factor BamD [Gammaproteobacteria bacterium]|nr:outer membrane protein assembly factor BamD [Gammaproteobacteria bacterium]
MGTLSMNTVSLSFIKTERHYGPLVIVSILALFNTACVNMKPVEKTTTEPAARETTAPVTVVDARPAPQLKPASPAPSAEDRYEQAKKALMAGNFSDAVRMYRELDVADQDEEKAAQARIELAYAYYRFGDSTSSIAVAERFIRRYPDHPNLDYVYYLRALANFRIAKQGVSDPSAENLPAEAALAIRDFEALTQRFPNSKYSKDATDRIVELKTAMARQDLDIAKTLLGKGRAAEAGLRASDVSRLTDDAGLRQQAKTLLDMAYRQLGLLVTPKKAPAVQEVRLHDETWIMAQKPSDLTLQLLGTSNQKALRRFIHNAELKGDMAFFETSVSGHPWFTLIYGRYTDRDAAERESAHVQDLAPAVKPWIRAMSEVQKQVTGIVVGRERMANPAALNEAVTSGNPAEPPHGDPSEPVMPPADGQGPEAQTHE